MKSKVISIVCVLVFCLSIFVFVEPCIAQEEEKRLSLEETIGKISSSLLTAKDFPPLKLRRLLKNLLDRNNLEFQDTAGAILPTETAIGTYWWNIVDDITHIELGSIGTPPIQSPVIKYLPHDASNDYAIDKEAEVRLIYHTGGTTPAQGEMTFTLFHMRICIWW